MSGNGHERTPLIFASRAACEAARRLLPGRVLENDVETALIAGHITNSNSRKVVFLDRGVVATIRRERSLLTGRRCWRVIRVHRPARNTANSGRHRGRIPRCMFAMRRDRDAAVPARGWKNTDVHQVLPPLPAAQADQ